MIHTAIIVTINGKKETLDGQTPLLDLLKARGLLGGRPIAIGYNHGVVHKDHWHEIVLKEGDTLDIVHMVGGG